MPTFMYFLNWTDQGAKALKDGPKRYEATRAMVTQLGGRLVCAYVTTGQYDVVLVVDFVVTVVVVVERCHVMVSLVWMLVPDKRYRQLLSCWLRETLPV